MGGQSILLLYISSKDPDANYPSSSSLPLYSYDYDACSCTFLKDLQPLDTHLHRSLQTACNHLFLASRTLKVKKLKSILASVTSRISCLRAR